MRWLELEREGTGEDLWRRHPWSARALDFRAAATAPDGRHGVTFGDPQYLIVGDAWCHDLVAARTGSRPAQHIADRLRDQPPEGTDHRHAPPRRRIYEFLWHDPVRPAAPSRNGLRWFPDGGQGFVRRGDALVAFRAGPPLGARRRRGNREATATAIRRRVQCWCGSMTASSAAARVQSIGATRPCRT